MFSARNEAFQMNRFGKLQWQFCVRNTEDTVVGDKQDILANKDIKSMRQRLACHVGPPTDFTVSSNRNEILILSWKKPPTIFIHGLFSCWITPRSLEMLLQFTFQSVLWVEVDHESFGFSSIRWGWKTRWCLLMLTIHLKTWGQLWRSKMQFSSF